MLCKGNLAHGKGVGWCLESGRLRGDIAAKYAELPGVEQ